MSEIEPANHRGEGNVLSAATKWSADNVVCPFVDAAIVEPARTLGHYIKPEWGNKEPAPLHPDWQNEPLSRVDAVTRTVFGTVGSLVPYVIAGFAAERGFGALSRSYIGEGAVADILTKPAVAQTVGATAYDALRAPVGSETKAGNAASTAASFSIFGLGNELATKLPGPESFAMRLAIGLAGGTGGALISQGMGKDHTIRWKDTASAGLGGAILNGLLPAGHSVAERVSNESRMAFGERAELGQYLDSFNDQSAAPNSNRFLGRMVVSDPRLALPEAKQAGHPTPMLPFRGAQETAAIDITDLNHQQRIYLVAKLEAETTGLLRKPAALKTLASKLQEAGRDWKDHNITQRVSEFEALTDEASEVAFASQGKTTPELTALQATVKERAEGITDVFRTRTKTLQSALNDWARSAGLPAVDVKLTTTPGYIASYTKGQGTMLLSASALSHEELTPQVVGAVGHEYTHGLQETEQLRAIADELGVGKVATPEDKTAIANEFKNRTKADNVNSDFLDRVLTLRDGKPLSRAERLHANRISRSLIRFDDVLPLKTYPALNGLLSNMKSATDVLNELKENQLSRDGLQQFGSFFADLQKQIPADLTELSGIKTKLAETGDVFANATVYDAGLAANVKARISDVVADLRGMREDAYRSYNTFSFEREAHSTGYLASLYYRAMKGTN